MSAAARSIGVIQGTQAAAAALNPTRARILTLLREPGSASGIAPAMGLPRQQVNYHLRELEREGLVELVEERRKGNCNERILRATARSYLIAPRALGELAPDAGASSTQDRFSWAALIGVAAQTIQDLAEHRDRADRAGKQLPTLSMQSEVAFANASSMNAFAEELATEVARLIQKHHAPNADAARLFRFNLGAYPVITTPDEPAPPTTRGPEGAQEQNP